MIPNISERCEISCQKTFESGGDPTQPKPRVLSVFREFSPKKFLCSGFLSEFVFFLVQQLWWKKDDHDLSQRGISRRPINTTAQKAAIWTSEGRLIEPLLTFEGRRGGPVAGLTSPSRA